MQFCGLYNIKQCVVLDGNESDFDLTKRCASRLNTGTTCVLSCEALLCIKLILLYLVWLDFTSPINHVLHSQLWNCILHRSQIVFRTVFVRNLFLKRLVHPKILSVFTHPNVVPNLNVFICSAEQKGRYLEECFNQTDLIPH